MKLSERLRFENLHELADLAVQLEEELAGALKEIELRDEGKATTLLMDTLIKKGWLSPAKLESDYVRLLAVARAAKEFSDNVRGWSTISIDGKKLAVVDDGLAEALAAVEDLL